MTYTCSKMTEKTYNNWFLLHVHKDLTDDLDLHPLQKNLFMQQIEQVKYFGNFF